MARAVGVFGTPRTDMMPRAVVMVGGPTSTFDAGFRRALGLRSSLRAWLLPFDCVRVLDYILHRAFHFDLFGFGGLLWLHDFVLFVDDLLRVVVLRKRLLVLLRCFGSLLERLLFLRVGGDDGASPGDQLNLNLFGGVESAFGAAEVCQGFIVGLAELSFAASARFSVVELGAIAKELTFTLAAIAYENRGTIWMLSAGTSASATSNVVRGGLTDDLEFVREGVEADSSEAEEFFDGVCGVESVPAVFGEVENVLIPCRMFVGHDREGIVALRISDDGGENRITRRRSGVVGDIDNGSECEVASSDLIGSFGAKTDGA